MRRPDQARLLHIGTAASVFRCVARLTHRGIDMAAAIINFEALPANARALILAKLAVTLRAQNSASLRELAKTHKTDVMSLWRSICRKAQQPVCSIPLEAIASD